MAKYTRPDYTAQTSATVRSNWDNSAAVFERGCGKYFNPHAQDTPNMTIRLQAGEIFNNGSRLEVAAQDTGTITAPTSNPRIDLVVVGLTSGAVSVVTGTESATPSAPALPTNKFPVAQITLQTSSAVISQSMITDVRGPFIYATAVGGGDAWGDAVDASIVPDTDSTYNIGSGTHYFASAYIDSITTTGNITVGGTVDGRDVATDGTKLDGIESGATADQSGAEIKALYEAEADTNAFTDALLSKLNGIEASADVTDEANVTSVLTAATTTVTASAVGDYVFVQDVSNSNALRRATITDILSHAAAGGDAWSDPVNSSIVPDTDSTYNLGDGTHYFANAYIDAITTTGNITVGGTVDGRDVATDGTKLDGIETGADVTDATNVIAALDNASITTTACATGDLVLIQDVSNSNALRRVTAQSIADFAAAGGGGGMYEYVSSAIITSATASIEFTGLTASAYRIEIVYIQAVTDGAALRLTASNDNGSSYASVDYQYACIYNDSVGGGVKDYGSAAGAYMPILDLGFGTATGEYGGFATVTLTNTSDAALPMFMHSEAGQMNASSGRMFSFRTLGVTADDANGGSTLDVDAVKIAFSTGNIAAAKVHLYKIVTS